MILLTLFDRVRWMTSLEFASFLYDVQLRAVMYDAANRAFFGFCFLLF